MTITISWKRRLSSGKYELMVASDSRLRSRGPIDQCQKIFRLDREDCCLGFCGDAQFAYPMFVQMGTALNNNIKTRSKADDISDLRDNFKKLASSLSESWNLTEEEKIQELKDTHVLLCGWSWKLSKFYHTYLSYESEGFVAHKKTTPIKHPWRDKSQSLVFLGDYKEDFLNCLSEVIEHKYSSEDVNGKPTGIYFDYEPLEALNLLLNKYKDDLNRPFIGGHPQLLKIYSYGKTLPFAIKCEDGAPSILGRKLLDWEKTELPIIDLRDGKVTVHYPMNRIPLAKDICGEV